MAADHDQIRESIEAGIQRLVASLDERIRSLVDELWQATQKEREEAVEEAVEAARAAAIAEATPPPPDETALERLRSELASRTDELATRNTELASRDAQLATRDAELASVRDQLAAATREPDEATGIADVSRRVVSSIRRLDGARSLTEVLDTLADALRDEAPRTALLVMKGTHAEAWRLSGFGSGIDSKQVQLGARMSGVFGRAATLGETTLESVDEDDDSAESGLPFAELPSGHRALAVPLVIGGRIAAVVYADDAGEPVEGDAEGWPGIVEVIARHGGRCLETLTAQRAQRMSTTG